MSNRCFLRRDRKTATEGAEVTCSGRLFQTRAAATGKARSPTVDSRVWLTICGWVGGFLTAHQHVRLFHAIMMLAVNDYIGRTNVWIHRCLCSRIVAYFGMVACMCRYIYTASFMLVLGFYKFLSLVQLDRNLSVTCCCWLGYRKGIQSAKVLLQELPKVYFRKPAWAEIHIQCIRFYLWQPWVYFCLVVGELNDGLIDWLITMYCYCFV